MLPRGISTLMKLPSYLKRLVSEAADKDMIKPMSGISSMTMRPSPKVKEQGLREYFKSTRNVDIDEELPAMQSRLRELTGGQKEIRANPELRRMADEVAEGVIPARQRRKVYDETYPRTEFEEVPEIISDIQLTGAVGKKAIDKGIYGVNKNIINEERVSSRLDIPAYRDRGIYATTIHKPKNETSTGTVIGYAPGIYLKGVMNKEGIRDSVKFNVLGKNPSLKTAKTGGEKNSYAAIDGAMQDVDYRDLKKYADEVIDTREWTQVGFNPDRGNYFFNKKTGQPVFEADEVIQIGEMVLAKGIQKPTMSQLKKLRIDVPGRKPQVYETGGMVEKNTYNYNTQRTI